MAGAAITKPQCFRLQIIAWLSELGNDKDKMLRRNLENWATIEYKSDLGNFPEVFHDKTKQRVYDEQRVST